MSALGENVAGGQMGEGASSTPAALSDVVWLSVHGGQTHND